MKLRAVCLILAIVLLSAASSFANNALQSQVVPPNAIVAGRSYGDWSAAWWQWALSNPVASNPLFDHGTCGQGQSGAVFFLGGSLPLDEP